jgi:hypothetical protein
MAEAVAEVVYFSVHLVNLPASEHYCNRQDGMGRHSLDKMPGHHHNIQC